jgi:hypothetical protein
VQLQVLESGTEFGGYRIEGLLGRGGMSEVYRASNPRLGNTIAVKLLTRELGSDEIFRERFVRESQLAASLNHPNVIPIFDAGEADGLPYIAMRYVDGPDLQELLTRDGALPIEAAIAIVGQIGAALDAAHEKGLIHRDVKPANILIESNGDSTPHVYLSDFGVAKHGGSRSGLTSTGQFVGTVDYIAPEQIEGKALSGATDVYSLACVLYQTLAGTPPFDRDTDVGMIYAHLVEPPPALTQQRPDLPAELDAVLAKALSKRPEDRYQSCREFVADVRGAVGLQAPASTGTGVNPRAAETRLAAASAPPTTEAPVPPTTAAPSPGLTPVGETVLAGAGSTVAASEAGPPPATADLTQAASSPPPQKVMPTELSEKKTVLMRRFWHSKRVLAAVFAALLIGGAAAAAAATLGGGSSSNNRSGTDRRRGETAASSGVGGSGTKVGTNGDRRRGQTGATSTTAGKNGTKTKAAGSKSKAKAKAKKNNRRRSTGTTTTSGNRRRGATGTTSNTTTTDRRRGATSTTSSSSGTTTTDRRRGATSSSGTSSGTSSDRRRR